ncbi:Transcriptional activator FtrB [Candidatus Filomicrobium marinum]|uniref:Transcriptional activator FtrB n=1 Tax=Candidatus Filomicrobium marinum TaxID=1608628 RepID=A0A0D6JK62_9HYPH|nr:MULTISPECIES: cyclic nucleotide-binding domain-containing protein [Filomicrobium]MCV0371273.1 cyclic nucleotide-binding domain-containing protein [Filomicrobium sp.]CFX59099.1 Transcriptional activator FtrB [Candidatus Filomicrobium marinum]CPR22353.1 Transcriptional activator FtrB [Candidatus Filomicrobium marinum]
MRREDSEIVRELPLFRGVELENFRTLIAAGYVQRFPTGTVLIHEGERPDFLHVLVDGQIAFFASHNDREATVSILTPPAAFILAAVIVDGPYLKSARTLSSSTVVLIPAGAVREVFERDTGFARATVAELACRYRTIVKELKNVRLRSSSERLANWILTQASQSGGCGTFRLPFEKRALASRLGMRPENLSRALAELAEAGVTVDGPMIRVGDAAKLIAFSKPNPLIDDPTS